MSFVAKLAAALACGNTVIAKPSEIAPPSALKLGELINEAGFPSGVVNILVGPGSITGRAISEHPIIRKVSITGSTATGRIVMETASKTNLKQTTLELGGKSPVVVFDDADLEKAIPTIVAGILCVLVCDTLHCNILTVPVKLSQRADVLSRIPHLRPRGYIRELSAGFQTSCPGRKWGDIFDPETNWGPIISKTQFEANITTSSMRAVI